MLELSLALVANLTGMYILGILTTYSMQTFSFRNKGNSYLYVLFGASFVELATHLITTVVQYYDFFGSQRLGIVMYSFVFTINAVYILAWVLYLNERLGKETVHDAAYRRRLLILTAPVFLLLGLSIANMFVPIYFSYHDFHYQRKGWYYLTLIIPVCYMIYGFVLFLRTNQRKKLYQELPFVAFILPVVLAHVLESLFIHLCVIPLANTLSLVILVLMNAKQNAAVDPLSGVYTKSELYRYFDEKVQHASTRNLRGIMIRLEYLKNINAEHGHKTGDMAISDMGFLIRSNLPNGAVAFHYADNEFLVLLEQMQEDEVRSVISKIKAELLQFNQKTATVYELHISYGIAALEENDTIDRFIDRMENRLYRNKQGKVQKTEEPMDLM
ncbi:MAG: GGDEF domain-containing protein [Eubacteriales bacterium]|nr:GGDEF domain-containing protein [Eubacteriales bacterium]